MKDQHYQTAKLVTKLAKAFYKKGWVSGTGGGISIKNKDFIYMAPSGVAKESMKPEDIFILDKNGKVHRNPENQKLKVSECHPLFMQAYAVGAGAVIHSHSIHAMLVTFLFKENFQIQNLEMAKGISNHRVFEACQVPIIANTEKEAQLEKSLAKAVAANPKAFAVLVRGHGVYIWGKDWQEAKKHAECYDYLFEAAYKLKVAGLTGREFV